MGLSVLLALGPSLFPLGAHSYSQCYLAQSTDPLVSSTQLQPLSSSVRFLKRSLTIHVYVLGGIILPVLYVGKHSIKNSH